MHGVFVLPADVLLRFFVKRLFAAGRAKVVRVPLILRLASSRLGIGRHATHWILCHVCLTSFHSNHLKNKNTGSLTAKEASFEPRSALVGRTEADSSAVCEGCGFISCRMRSADKSACCGAPPAFPRVRVPFNSLPSSLSLFSSQVLTSIGSGSIR